MRLHIVLEDEATQRSGWLIFGFESGEDEDQVVVKVRKLVELFEFLPGC